MSNVKVTLVHKDATDYMRRSAARVIDGSLLQAVTPEGRFAEAKTIYNRMLGIKSTPHEYETVETDEPPSVPVETPVSAARDFQQAQEDKMLGRMAGMLAQGIAEGVAKALAAHGISDESSSLIGQATVAVPVDAPAESAMAEQPGKPPAGEQPGGKQSSSGPSASTMRSQQGGGKSR